MIENQNIEWKESWHDDYLNWICGYANAQGGNLCIGVNNKGQVVGVSDAKKLLGTLPNKIRNAMGIVVDVDHKSENGLEYISITVPPHPFPVSCRGKYYYRTGSTLQLLSGASLDEFMLRKQGLTWDGTPVPHETVSALKKEAIELFRKKAFSSKRLSEEDLSVTDEMLLRNLRLYKEDYLIMAAIMMFHPDPEKWVRGAYIKIGFFGKSDSDLLYQDEVHGPLIEQVDRVVELVYQKYMKALIHYEDMLRMETPMFPRTAFREILLNAVMHRDYSVGIPIQISVYETKMYIWNPGKLPEEITLEMLFEKHSSIPRNPSIADVFFKTGMVETWGRGYDKIRMSCKEDKTPLPVCSFMGNGMMVLCKESRVYAKLRREYALTDGGKNVIENVIEGDKNVIENVIEIVMDSETLELNFSKKQRERVEQILELIKHNHGITISSMAQQTGVTQRTIARDLEKLTDLGVIRRTGSDVDGYWEIQVKQSAEQV